MIPLTDERLRQLAYDEYVCISESGRAMAVELLAARARIAEIAAMFHLPNDDTLPSRLRKIQREVADRIVKLAVESEAAQRPPLGYVVVAPAGSIWMDCLTDRATAERELAELAVSSPVAGWRVVELREVQP